MHIKPFDYYRNIEIPILFVHGVYDYNVPVESTVYIQENLSDKPFYYMYFPWEHVPENPSNALRFRKEVTKWLKKIDELLLESE